MRLRTWLPVLAFIQVAMLLALVPEGRAHNTYFFEDWESGQGLWNVSNGVWQIGTPTHGTTVHFGQQCAGTNLHGNYPQHANTRLESPLIQLPQPGELKDGVLWLGFWHWFNNAATNGVDYGQVEIWTVDDGWQVASNQFIRESSVWTPFYVDMTEFAGKTVRIGFYFRDQHTGSTSYVGPGWFVDQVKIFDGRFPDPMGKVNRFDRYWASESLDWEGWYPDRGVWELGEPTSGIGHAHSPRRCFGTNLAGHYPFRANSRLISPHVNLPAAPLDGKLFISWKQYCSLHSTNGWDQGHFQINDGTGWTTLYTLDRRNNQGGKWTEYTHDISDYAGARVRFGFVIEDNHTGSTGYQSTGWYIDDFQFSEGRRHIGNPETFDNYAPNWGSLRGLWEIGTPTAGPGAAHSPPYCWGTNLGGNYPQGADDTLISPPILLPSTGPLYLRFRHWFSFNGTNGTDEGFVRILPQDGDWTDILGPYRQSSGGWSFVTYDLAAYAGQSVRFGFRLIDRHTGSTAYQSSGWYIDDFEIVGMPQSAPPDDVYYFTVDISSGPAELNFYHQEDGIDKVVIYGSPVPDFKPTLGTRLAVLPGSATQFFDVMNQGWPALYYRVSVVDHLGNESVPIQANVITSVEDSIKPPSAKQLVVRPAYPNPFNPMTTISFDLPVAGKVDVAVYDVRGRKVADLLHENLSSGRHEVTFAPRDLASGTYFARVAAHGETKVTRMMLIK